MGQKVRKMAAENDVCVCRRGRGARYDLEMMAFWAESAGGPRKYVSVCRRGSTGWGVAQGSPGYLQEAIMALNEAKYGPKGPKWSQYGPKWSLIWPPDGLNMAPGG